MIKSFPLHRSSNPDFDSPFLCLDLPASNYELEMKRFILFLFLLLFYYHAVLARPRLTFSFSSALLQSFQSTLADTWETTAVLCKKAPPFFTAIICQVTFTSAPRCHDYDQFLVAISFKHKMNG